MPWSEGARRTEASGAGHQERLPEAPEGSCGLAGLSPGLGDGLALSGPEDVCDPEL